MKTAILILTALFAGQALAIDLPDGSNFSGYGVFQSAVHMPGGGWVIVTQAGNQILADEEGPFKFRGKRRLKTPADLLPGDGVDVSNCVILDGKCDATAASMEAWGYDMADDPNLIQFDAQKVGSRL